MLSSSNLEIPDLERLERAPRPDLSHLADHTREHYERTLCAVVSVVSGRSVTHASKAFRICPKRLRKVLTRLSELAADGDIEGFRACLPYSAYRSRDDGSNKKPIPTEARPHAFEKVLATYPDLEELIQQFRTPLPRGRAPRSFDRLHAKLLQFLRSHGHSHQYPFTSKDLGRKALLRIVRKRRIAGLGAGLATPTAPTTTTTPPLTGRSGVLEALLRQPFERVELDAHRIDIESVVEVELPNGGSAKQKIYCLWLLVMIDTSSRAVLGWSLRPGRSYDALDVTKCVASAIHPWSKQLFTIPGLEYSLEAAMPQGGEEATAGHRSIVLALDNFKAHHSEKFLRSFCDFHDGILYFGRPHQPKSRPIVEAFFGKLEAGVLRKLPGGFEPATRLGEKRVRIASFTPDRHPLQMRLLEELMEFIVTNYNATPHPSLGTMSPLQFLAKWKSDRPETVCSRVSDGIELAQQMMTVSIKKRVSGSKSGGNPPSIHHAYVRYSSREFAQAWELVGKQVVVRVDRSDLRQVAVFCDDSQRLLGVLTASRPWDNTRHDEQTRKLVYRWIKSFRIDTADLDCAIAAYTKHLRSTASQSVEAATHLAFMDQRYGRTGKISAPEKAHLLPSSSARVPRGGWVSLGKKGGA